MKYKIYEIRFNNLNMTALIRELLLDHCLTGSYYFKFYFKYFFLRAQRQQ